MALKLNILFKETSNIHFTIYRTMHIDDYLRIYNKKKWRDYFYWEPLVNYPNGIDNARYLHISIPRSPVG